MKPIYLCIALLLGIILQFPKISAQKVLVNVDWTVNEPGNYFLQKACVKTDIHSDVYTLGSALSVSNGYDFLLQKISKTGDSIVWTVRFDGDGHKDDIAADMFIDSDLNVYIVGASWQNGTDSADACIVKYKADGTMAWKHYYNGSGGYNDVYSAISASATGDLVLGGTIGTAINGQDFLMTELDTSGTELLSRTYDYTGLHDVAAKVEVKGFSVYLTGVSQTDAVTWDAATIRYDFATGIATDTFRTVSGSGTIHAVDGFKGYNGKLYLTGSVSNPLTGRDMKTIVLDENLVLEWQAGYNSPDSLDDFGTAVAIDDLENVYVTGRTQTGQNGNDAVTVKYNGSGVQQWVKTINGVASGNDDGTDIIYENGNVYVAGNLTNAPGNSTHFLRCYDTAGGFVWHKNSSISLPGPAVMAFDSQGAIILATQHPLALLTEKFSAQYIFDTIYSDTSLFSERYVKNQLIVSFNPSIVKTVYVDDRDKLFGRITDFLPDSTISKMSTSLGFSLMTNKYIFVEKIFRRLTTTDTVSISRNGRSTQVPPLWATLLLHLPPCNIEMAADTLASIFPDIYSIDKNYVYMYGIGADDTEYNEQESLHPSPPYLDGNINIEPAWDIETGQSFVKIGIMDSGIKYAHPDLQNPMTASGSAVEGGHDYVTNMPIFISPEPDDYGHGSACAGIVGALRNNNLGIAGIGGGDKDNFEIGVSLYAQRVGDANGPYASYMFDAILEGAFDNQFPNSSIGYGLHGINCSILTYAGIGNTLNILLRFAFQNDCFISCARGNDGVNNFTAPACAYDEYVLNVGASGWNGEWKTSGFGDPTDVQDNNYSSNYGQGIDVIAPGTKALVTTLDNSLSNDYVLFNGTSAAAPHVSGVAGLMQSQYEGMLSVEDIEYFIETFADDKGTSNYDDYSGHGLLNAGSVLENILKPQFDVLHVANYQPGTSATLTMTEEVSGTVVHFLNNFFGYAEGAYLADMWRVDCTIAHTLPSGYSIIDAWPRNSASLGWSSFPILDPEYNPIVYLDNITPTSADMHTYFFQLSTGQWLPSDPNLPINQAFAYSLYIRNPTFHIEEVITSTSLTIYPNPAEEMLDILFTLDNISEVSFSLFDIHGRTIMTERNQIYTQGNHQIQINVSDFDAGLYLLRMQNNRESRQTKIIIK